MLLRKRLDYPCLPGERKTAPHFDRFRIAAIIDTLNLPVEILPQAKDSGSIGQQFGPLTKAQMGEIEGILRSAA